MIVYDVDQPSPEWHGLRRGIPTASNFSRILCAEMEYTVVDADGEMVSNHRKYEAAEKALEKFQKKGGTGIVKAAVPLSDGRDGLIDELMKSVEDEFLPPNAEHFTTRHIEHGIETEATARRSYALDYGQVVRAGFLTTDCGRYGASPDGLVIGGPGDMEVTLWGKPFRIAGGLELKCPDLSTFIGWVRKGGLPRQHKAQVHGGLAITGLPWWDFYAYAECPDIPPYRFRVYPDDYTKALRDALDLFWGEYILELTKLNIQHRLEPVLRRWLQWKEAQPKQLTGDPRTAGVPVLPGSSVPCKGHAPVSCESAAGETESIVAGSASAATAASGTASAYPAGELFSEPVNAYREPLTMKKRRK